MKTNYSKAFVPGQGSSIDPTKIQIAGNVVNLDQIKKDVAFLTSQDKEHVMNMLVCNVCFNKTVFIKML